MPAFPPHTMRTVPCQATDDSGRLLGPPSDVFSLGALLYELLCAHMHMAYMHMACMHMAYDWRSYSTIVLTVVSTIVLSTVRARACLPQVRPSYLPSYVLTTCLHLSDVLTSLRCGAAPFEYVQVDDESEFDECDDFDTVRPATLRKGSLQP